MLFSRLLIATSSVAIMGNSMVEGFAASRSSQIVSFHLSYYLHRVRCVVDYNASPLGGPLCTIYGVHNEEGRCVILCWVQCLAVWLGPLFYSLLQGGCQIPWVHRTSPLRRCMGTIRWYALQNGFCLMGGGCWVPSPLWGEVDAGYPSRVNSYLGLALGTHELITDTERCTIPPKPLYRLLCCIAEYVIFICHATVLHPFILELICITCVC